MVSSTAATQRWRCVVAAYYINSDIIVVTVTGSCIIVVMLYYYSQDAGSDEKRTAAMDWELVAASVCTRLRKRIVVVSYYRARCRGGVLLPPTVRLGVLWYCATAAVWRRRRWRCRFGVLSERTGAVRIGEIDRCRCQRRAQSSPPKPAVLPRLPARNYLLRPPHRGPRRPTRPLTTDRPTTRYHVSSISHSLILYFSLRPCATNIFLPSTAAAAALPKARL